MTHQVDSVVFRYEKLAFSRDEPRPPIRVPDRLRFKSVTRETLDLFITTIEHALEGSLDRFDQFRLARSTPHEIAESYARPSKDDFAFEIAWWQLACGERS